jgi:hypothetical protein
LASNTVQLGASDLAAGGGSQAQAGAPVSSYHVISNADPSKDASLFSFRSEIEVPEPEANAQAVQSTSSLRPILSLVGIVALLGLLGVLAFPMLIPKAKAPAQYIDLGNRRFDPSGLAGRLIVHWDDNAKFQLYIDPVDQEQATGFQTVAVIPPHPLTVLVQLLDAQDVVTCQKEIMFPPPPPRGTQLDSADVLAPKVTASGDTVQDVAGSDGQVAEITVSGPLPCSIDAYRHFSGWQFSANFPTVADQKGPLNHPIKLGTAWSSGGSSSGGGWRGPGYAFQHLNAPIEGDDVIVGDNAAKGIVDTNSGRMFLVSASGWRTRSADWQIFPAAVHFRCDKTGSCTLTRVSSRTILMARLLK